MMKMLTFAKDWDLKTKWWYPIFIFLVIMVGLGFLFFFIPPASFRAWLGLKNQNLAFWQGTIHKDGPWVEVTKKKSIGGIEIEVVLDFLKEDIETRFVHQKWNLDGAFDNFLVMNERVSGLILVDFDEDGWQDILVPYLDYDLRSLIAIYRYDPLIQRFVRYH